MVRKTMSSILGWYGVAAIITAYAMLTFGIFDAGNLWYQVMNLTGAIGIIVDAVADKNTQPVVLNIFWVLIAVWAIIQRVL
jgi:hypothetical protein